MSKKQIIKKYKEWFKEALNASDNEIAHGNYDSILEELIIELGYGELLDFANQLIKERDICFWYA